MGTLQVSQNTEVRIDCSLPIKKTIRVLHVDDDLCILEVTKQILSSENNFEIDNATSVTDAFKKMEEQSYDAIVSDYEMPLKNGLEFLKEIREKNNQIPFILFTGKGREDVAVKALNLGADSYLNKNGSPETVYCELAHAINKSVEAKKAGEILRESEQKYRELANCLPNIVFEADLQGQLEFANERAAEISGYSLSDIEKGLNILQFIVPEDRENTLKNIQRVLSGGNYSPKEYTFLRKDGTTFPALVTANPRINKNKITGFRGLVLDITERKKAEEVVRKSEQRYRELANFLPEIVFETDLNGKIIFFSQQAFEVTGFTPDEIEKGMNLISFVIPNDRKRAEENIKKALAGELRDGNEYTLCRKNGVTYPALVKTTPIISEGKVVGLRGIVIDISESKKLELELRQKYNLLERVGESIGAGLAIVGKDYRIIWANDTLKAAMTDRNKKCYQNFTKIDAVCPDCGVKKVFEGNSSLDIHEYKTINSNGETVWIELRATPLLDNNGKITAALELAVPISERKKTEEELRKSLDRERFLGDLIRTSSFAIAVAFPDGRLMMGNEAFQKLTGYSEEELKSVTWNEILTPTEWRNHEAEKLKEISVSKKSGVYRKEYVRKDGAVIPVELVVQPFFDEKQNLAYYFGFVTDITAKKKAEDELRESQHLNKKILCATPNLIYIYDLQEKCNIYANKEVFYFLGYTSEQIKSMGSNLFANLLHPDDAEKVAKHHARFANILDNEIYEIDYRMKHSNGEWRWLRSRDTIFSRTETGVGKQILGITEDITERKKAKLMLLASEEKFRKAFLTSPDAFYIGTLEEGIILETNERFEDVFGFTRQETIGKTSVELGLWANPRDRQEIVSRLRADGKVLNFETCGVRKNGQVFPLQISISVVHANNLQLILGIVKDISSNKQAEAALRKSEANYRILTENMRDVIWTMDLNGHFTYVSPSVLQLRGFTSEETMKQTLSEALTHNSLKQVMDNIKQFRKTGKITSNYYEVEQTCKDGSTVWTEVNISLLPSKYGENKSIFGVSRDITERKKAEEEIKNEKRNIETVNEKLQVVGGLTRHDVRNKLMVMKANAYLLKKEISNSPKLLKYIEGINSAIEETKQIIEFSQAYEKIGSEKLTDINVKECFDEAVSLFSDLETVKVTNECQGLTVSADSLLRQVLYNLVENSLKHGKTVTQIRLHYKEGNDGVKLIYEDNGVGIPQPHKTILFSKGLKSSNGSGLGLKFVKKIMEVYRWNISEKGQPSKGAKFVLEIPKIKQTTQKSTNRDQSGMD